MYTYTYTYTYVYTYITRSARGTPAARWTGGWSSTRCARLPKLLLMIVCSNLASLFEALNANSCSMLNIVSSNFSVLTKSKVPQILFAGDLWPTQ